MNEFIREVLHRLEKIEFKLKDLEMRISGIRRNDESLQKEKLSTSFNDSSDGEYI